MIFIIRIFFSKNKEIFQVDNVIILHCVCVCVCVCVRARVRVRVYVCMYVYINTIGEMSLSRICILDLINLINLVIKLSMLLRVLEWLV